MIKNIRKRKYMTLDEKIKEEEEYSQQVENKIKYFSNKTKDKKEKVQKQENLIEFMKEMNFFKQKQKKLENEILLLLSNLEESNNNSEGEKEKVKPLNEFFEIINMEKSIQNVFNKNCLMVINMVRQGREKEFIKTVDLNPEPVIKVLEYLNSFNKQIISSHDEDINAISSESENICVKENKDLEQFIPLYKFIFNNDYYNIFEIYDIKYIVALENYFNNDSTSKSEDYFIKNIDFSKYILFDKLITKVDDNLLVKSNAILGEAEYTNIAYNISSLNELTYIKYFFEMKDYLKDINAKINDLSRQNKLSVKECLKFQNIYIFFKSNLINRAKYSKRLEFEFPSKKRDDMRGYEDILTIIYNFKQKRKIIQANYIKELAELTLNLNEVVENNIENEMKKIKKSVEEKEFASMNEKMKHLHKIHTEKYELQKQKQEEELRIKQEKTDQENLLRKEKLKQHNDEIRTLANIHKSTKKEKENKEKKKRDEEQLLLQKKIKEEIKKNKPKVEFRQHLAENEFINQQKIKETIKQQKLIKEQQLEEIIQNLKVRPNVAVDPERVKQITECLKLRKETVADEGDKVVLFKVNGFSVNQLMNDMRYKISSALHEAGMLQTPYAHDLLKGINNKIMK